MSRCFADTHYFLALLNKGDVSHRRAVEFSRRNNRRLLTTAWIVVEVADALAHPPNRRYALILRDLLRVTPSIHVVPADAELFEAGFDLFEQRADKAWSLTDCISFVVMKRERITDALTGDHHFEQAGFHALLR